MRFPTWVILNLVLSGTAVAGIETWSSEGGPFGARVDCITVPQTLTSRVFAGTERGGVFRSDSDGAGWRSCNTGITVQDVQVLAVHPTNASLVFAGTAGAGVFRTLNGGEFWTPVNSGLSNLRVCELEFFSDGSRVYAGTAGGGIYWSPDWGSQWFASNTGLTSLSIQGLAVSPSDNGTLYVGTTSGVFQSADSGATWVPKPNGLSHPFIGALAVHPTDSDVVYAGTLGGGVYKSLDGGGVWAQTPGMGSAYVRDLVVDFDHPDTLRAATNHGVYESHDGAVSWTLRNTGLADTTTWALAEKDDSLLAGGYWGGVAVSADLQAGWSDRNAGLTNRFVCELTQSPHDTNTIWAATYGGLSVSTDNGLNWSDSFSGVDTFDLRTVVVSPATPDQMLAGAFYGGVFRSIDGGASWISSSTGLAGFGTVTAIRYQPGNGNTVLCGTYSGLHRSHDGGATWSSSWSGMGSNKVWGLATSTADSMLVYLGTYANGVFRSTDFGLSWVSVPVPDNFVRAVAIDPSDPATVYAGGYYQHSGLGGVYKSTDGGTNWVSKNAGLGNLSVWSIAVSPSDPNHLLAATFDGIFESLDGAESWNALSNGLEVRDVRSILIAGSTYHAGTYGGSAVTYEVVTTGIPPIQVASRSSLLQAYPNPFNPTTTLEVLAPDGVRGLAIYDIRGRLIRTLLDGGVRASAGDRIVWDGRNDMGSAVPSGVYFARSASGVRHGASRLVLVR